MTTNHNAVRDAVRRLILSDDTMLERAILAIYERQTSQEQQVDATLNRNDVGFNSADASPASYMARWIKSGRRLSGKFLEKARRMMPKYAGQIAEIAIAKGTVDKLMARAQAVRAPQG